MKIGNNCLISNKISIYNDNIEIGNNVRIDDFCILTGDIKLGSNIHIAAYSFLSGIYGIELEDFAQVSGRCSIYSASDDYSGRSLVGPVIDDKYKPFLEKGKIILKRHSLLGCNTTVMPGVTVGEGAATGAYTFVKNDLLPWGIYNGIPAKFFKERSKEILKLEEEYGTGKTGC